MPRTAFFTICARNYLAYARNLRSRLKKHHPTCDFFVFLSDESSGVDQTSLDFPVVPIEALNIDKIEDMKWYYNITEFSTALKPFAFSQLFSDGYDRVVYFDPDILIISQLTELFEMFDAGATCVLTPHLTSPRPTGEIDDARLLQLGTFNLGFCGLQRENDVLELVNWWGWRLRTHCLIDLPQGLFVDQKWADLFPSFVAGFHALRHPGYNLAYWNLHQRKVTEGGAGYLVNGLPLRFIHFSGFDIRDRSRLTRHIGNTERSRIGVVANLIDDFAAGVLLQEHENYTAIPYAFSWNGARGKNLHTPEPIHQRSAPASPTVSRLRKLRSSLSGAGSAVQRHGLRPETIGRAIKHVRLHGLKDLLRNLAELADRERQLSAPVGGQRWPRDPAKVKIAQLLFVDWNLPNPATDAGGLFSFQIVRVLRSMGIETTILPLEWKAHDHQPLYDALGAKVADVAAWPSARDFIAATAGQFDALILNRAPAIFPVLGDLIEHHGRSALILNTHDLHYLRQGREAALSGDPLAAQSAARVKQEELRVIAEMDAVWIVSNIETYLLAQEDDDVPVLLQPLVADEGPSPAGDHLLVRDSLVFVGSFDHAPNVDAVNWFVSKVWPSVTEAHPQIRLKIIGKNFPESLSWISRMDRIEVVGWVAELEPHFSRAIASIAPLRFGAGVKGKLLTSWSFGVPVIGTEIAKEGLPGTCGEAFFEAATASEVVDAISTLTRPSDWQLASDVSRSYLRAHFSIAHLQKSLQDLFKGFEVGNGPVPNRHAVENYPGYAKHEQLSKNIWIKRRQYERELVNRSEELIQTNGYCAVCGCQSLFTSSYQWSSSKYEDGKEEPNWREHLACRHCGLVTRLRATIHHLQTTSLRRDERVYLTERVTPFYSYMAQRVQDITGSEYFGTDYAPGQFLNGTRHEDIQRLSFPDKSFDLIVSLDVLEHVPDYEKALTEMHRCLKPGGRLVVTVPFTPCSPRNVTRAEILGDGTLVHHLPPEYHGNPVDHEGGALCYRYFGWDFLKFARSTGFSSATAYSYWSRRYQYLGTENWIFEFIR